MDLPTNAIGSAERCNVLSVKQGRRGDPVPGGRLTHADRRQIAAWLADGLGYAEIGRRFGRPTSTISREVARNGGPGAYQADPAHQAAGDRARRRKPPR